MWNAAAEIRYFCRWIEFMLTQFQVQNVQQTRLWRVIFSIIPILKAMLNVQRERIRWHTSNNRTNHAFTWFDTQIRYNWKHILKSKTKLIRCRIFPFLLHYAWTDDGSGTIDEDDVDDGNTTFVLFIVSFATYTPRLWLW